MQYIISQKEYNDLQSTIAELSRDLARSRGFNKKLIGENKRLRSLIKDIAGTVQTMSDKAEQGSDFDIEFRHGTVTVDQYGQVHRD